MSSEMRELVRKAEALAVCVMAVDSYSRDELRVFAENFRDEARALLARTAAAPLLDIDSDEPSDAMMDFIASKVDQSRTCDEAIGDPVAEAGGGITLEKWEKAVLRASDRILARTEAGADGAVAHIHDYGDRVRVVWDKPWGDFPVGTQFYTHPQDASGDAESTALYLRPYDVTMIGQAKHAGQDMVSVLAHLHPTEGWDVRFNAAMQAKEAK